jgi:hypothetical protein
VDMNWYGILTLKMLGFAKQIKTAELPKVMRKENAHSQSPYVPAE